jgi:hypothetical protein
MNQAINIHGIYFEIDDVIKLSNGNILKVVSIKELSEDQGYGKVTDMSLEGQYSGYFLIDDVIEVL